MVEETSFSQRQLIMMGVLQSVQNILANGALPKLNQYYILTQGHKHLEVPTCEMCFVIISYFKAPITCFSSKSPPILLFSLKCISTNTNTNQHSYIVSYLISHETNFIAGYLIKHTKVITLIGHIEPCYMNTTPELLCRLEI